MNVESLGKDTCDLAEQGNNLEGDVAVNSNPESNCEDVNSTGIEFICVSETEDTPEDNLAEVEKNRLESDSEGANSTEAKSATVEEDKLGNRSPEVDENLERDGINAKLETDKEPSGLMVTKEQNQVNSKNTCKETIDEGKSKDNLAEAEERLENEQGPNTSSHYCSYIAKTTDEDMKEVENETERNIFIDIKEEADNEYKYLTQNELMITDDWQIEDIKNTAGSCPSAPVDGERVRIVKHSFNNKDCIKGTQDENVIVVYCKKFVLYKGHEYLLLTDKNKDENTWKCNKSQKCTALLIIGKAPNNKVYEVSEHNCAEPMDALNETHFKKYKFVNVLYFKGFNMLDLISDHLYSLDEGTIVLCQYKKIAAKEAFYNGHKYIKRYTRRNSFEYWCLFAGCKGTILVSLAGIDKKKVLEGRCHTCKRIQTPRLQEVAPRGFTAARPIKYKTYDDLALFMKISQLLPNSQTPLICINEQGYKNEVFYKGYEYSVLFNDKPDSSGSKYLKCSTSWCFAHLQSTLDFTAVAEISKHTCDVGLDKTSHVYNLMKISKLDKNVSVLSATDFVDQSEYRRVNYVYAMNLPADLDPTDEGTVRVYFDVKRKGYLYYYKGYTYKYGASIRLCLCSRSASCAAVLITKHASPFASQSLEVKEIGKHTCTNKRVVRKEHKLDNVEQKPDIRVQTSANKKQEPERPCPPLSLIPPKESLPSKATPNITDIDKLSYKSVRIRNCLATGVNVAELDLNDSSTVYVYRDETKRQIVYYKGYTYHKNHLIYLCSKSRGCSAALIPDTDGRCQLAEIGEHNCNLTLGNSSVVSHEPKPIEFRICAVKEFSQVPGFDPNDQTVVTMLLSDFQRHNIVYYKGNTYVDDRSISCERGSRLTRKSCNLLYMCVKSNVCSAGLITNLGRTTIMEVGLHNCLKFDYTADNTKLFKELKPVKFCHNEGGKPDTQGIIDTQVVATYFELGKKSAFYKGYTYVDRITGCSHSVGCKCLYMCNKRPDCSAAILVDSRQAVLEVGLHSCQAEDDNSSQPEPTTSTDVVSLTPEVFTTTSLDTFGYGARTEVNAPHERDSTLSKKVQPLSLSKYNNPLPPRLTKVPNKYSRKQKPVRKVSARNAKKRKVDPGKQIGDPYQLKKALQNILFEEQISTRQNQISPSKANQRFSLITGQYSWSPSLIPALDDKEKLFVIYEGHIYSYTYHIKHKTRVESDWTCINSCCVAVLHLDDVKVIFTSGHFCVSNISEIVPLPNNVASTDQIQPFQLLHGQKKYLVHLGYIYQLGTTGWGISLICVYREQSGCPGALAIKNNAPLLTCQHSCKKLALDGAERTEVIDCTEEFTIKQEEIDLPEVNEIKFEDEFEMAAEGSLDVDEAAGFTIKKEVDSEEEEAVPTDSLIEDAAGFIDKVTVKKEIENLEDYEYVTVKQEIVEEIDYMDSATDYYHSNETTVKFERNDLTIKEEIVEQAYVDDSPEARRLDLLVLPDLVPFSTSKRPNEIQPNEFNKKPKIETPKSMVLCVDNSAMKALYLSVETQPGEGVTNPSSPRVTILEAELTKETNSCGSQVFAGGSLVKNNRKKREKRGQSKVKARPSDNVNPLEDIEDVIPISVVLAKKQEM